MEEQSDVHVCVSFKIGSSTIEELHKKLKQSVPGCFRKALSPRAPHWLRTFPSLSSTSVREKCIFSMPKGWVTCMDVMFRKMAGNMNGPGRKLEGERDAHGTKSVLYALWNFLLY